MINAPLRIRKETKERGRKFIFLEEKRQEKREKKRRKEMRREEKRDVCVCV